VKFNLGIIIKIIIGVKILMKIIILTIIMRTMVGVIKIMVGVIKTMDGETRTIDRLIKIMAGIIIKIKEYLVIYFRIKTSSHICKSKINFNNRQTILTLSI
jgi:uncharacterized membrane protein HdeD (DUF308 family)